MFRDGRMPEVSLVMQITQLARLSKSVEAESIDPSDSVVLSEQEVVSLGADGQ